MCEDLANSCHGSSECSTSPRVWQLLAKLTYLTWPIYYGVEENFICCGEFSIFGGGLCLLLNFCMRLVEMCTSFLIVVHSILFNMVVFSAFLFRWMDLDQHRCLNFGCPTLGCWDVDNSGFSGAEMTQRPRLRGPKGPHLNEFLRCGQSSYVVSHLLLIAVKNVKACWSHFSILRTRWADQCFSVALGGPLHLRAELASDTKLSCDWITENPFVGLITNSWTEDLATWVMPSLFCWVSVAGESKTARRNCDSTDPNTLGQHHSVKSVSSRLSRMDTPLWAWWSIKV